MSRRISSLLRIGEGLSHGMRISAAEDPGRHGTQLHHAQNIHAREDTEKVAGAVGDDQQVEVIFAHLPVVAAAALTAGATVCNWSGHEFRDVGIGGLVDHVADAHDAQHVLRVIDHGECMAVFMQENAVGKFFYG